MTMRTETTTHEILSLLRTNYRCLILFAIPILLSLILYMVHFRGDLFADEMATYRFIQLPHLKFFDPERASTSILFLKSAKAGAWLVGEPWGVRIASALFATATVVIVGYLARDLLGPQYQWLAMLLAAISPMMVEFGAEARPYTMMAFWSTAFFLCLIRFERRETWTTALLLGLVAMLGCLTRIIFAANLLFGVIYYLIKRKRVTGYFIMISLFVMPVFIRALILFYSYGHVAPKEQMSIDAVSTINFVLKSIFVFNFGYNTLILPELSMSRNVPMGDILQANAALLALLPICGVGFCLGVIRFARQDRSNFIFLLLAILVPSACIILIGQLGYTILREKFLIGALGIYLVLLTVIFVEIGRSRFGWFYLAAFISVWSIGFYHYFFIPEEYSRRDMKSALSREIMQEMRRDDVLMAYRVRNDAPNYYRFLDQSIPYIDIYQDKPSDMDLKIYIEGISQAAPGRILLISRETVRNLVDPHGIVKQTLSQDRVWKRKKFGRNLSLYVYSKASKLVNRSIPPISRLVQLTKAAPSERYPSAAE